VTDLVVGLKPPYRQKLDGNKRVQGGGRRGKRGKRKEGLEKEEGKISPPLPPIPPFLRPSLGAPDT
jgi:hypothetical protein